MAAAAILLLINQKNNYIGEIDKESEPQKALNDVVGQPSEVGSEKINSTAEGTIDIGGLKAKIDALLELENKIQTAGGADSQQSLGLLDNYKSEFISYSAATSENNVAAVNKVELKAVRSAEWQNYRNFAGIKDKLSGVQYRGKIAEIQKSLDSYPQSRSAKLV